MKTNTDTENKITDKNHHRHTSLYIFVAIVFLAFGLLYVYGYILYHN